MKIAVALGGGGSRGNSHIGVLRVLEREGFKICAIAGTSFGGLVACFYAAGFAPDQIEDTFAGIDQSRLYSRSADESPSLLGLSRVSDFLTRAFGNRTFESLQIPCCVTAVDLRRSREVIIKSGAIVDGLRATVALPGIFPSFIRGDEELIDGGMLDPVPVMPARALRPGLPVVAVSLAAELGTPPREFTLPFLRGIPAPLAASIKKLRIAQATTVMMQTSDIVGRQLEALRLELEKPAVIIRPELDHIGTLAQVDVRRTARAGEDATLAVLPQLNELRGWQYRFGRWAGWKRD